MKRKLLSVAIGTAGIGWSWTALANPDSDTAEERLQPRRGLYAVHADGGIWNINADNGVPHRARRKDQQTGQVIPWMFDLSGVTGLATDMENHVAFVATGDGDDSLYGFLLETGQLVWLASLGVGTNVQSLDIAPDAALYHGFLPGALYGIDIDGTQTCGVNCLLEVNLFTGVVNEIGSLALNQGRSLSFHPDGSLWVMDSGGESLYTVDPTGALTWQTALETSFPDGGSGLGTAFSMSWTRDGRLYAADVDNGVLVELDPATGAGTWVGEAGILFRGGTQDLQGLDGGW